MAIILQSTVGGFTAEFMRRLPELEQAMVAHGLEPSQFVISKDRATPATVPVIGPFFYDYTVFAGDAGRHQIPGVFLPALHRGGRGRHHQNGAAASSAASSAGWHSRFDWGVINISTVIPGCAFGRQLPT